MKLTDKERCFIMATVDIWDITAQVTEDKWRALRDLGYWEDEQFVSGCPLCEEAAYCGEYVDCDACRLLDLWRVNADVPELAVCQTNTSPYTMHYDAELAYDRSFFAQMIADEAYALLGGLRMKKMSPAEVCKNLCVYDERNPDYLDFEDKTKGDCFCDNCFYGRTELALEIIKYWREDSE